MDTLPPAALLPGQFYAPRGYSPAKKLLWAILYEAYDNLKYDSRLAREALTWINTERPDWPCSFRNICECLNLDADYLRQGLVDYAQHAGRHERHGMQGEVLPRGIHIGNRHSRSRTYRVTRCVGTTQRHYHFATLAEAITFREQYHTEKRRTI